MLGSDGNQRNLFEDSTSFPGFLRPSLAGGYPEVIECSGYLHTTECRITHEFWAPGGTRNMLG